MKDYGGNFQSTLQWQNKNGDAHYNTKDGKNFTCNIPELDESETIVTSTKLSLDEEMAYVRNKIDLMFDMIKEQYVDYTDRKNNSS